MFHCILHRVKEFQVLIADNFVFQTQWKAKIMAKQNRRLATNICGKRVKLARVEAGMNQLELATALNLEHHLQVDQNSISLIEKGTRFVKDYEITALAEVLNVTPMWFLYGDDQPKLRETPMK